jgi:hypothetical protein
MGAAWTPCSVSTAPKGPEVLSHWTTQGEPARLVKCPACPLLLTGVLMLLGLAIALTGTRRIGQGIGAGDR